MDEFDLKDIWKDSDDQAEKFYQSIEPEVLELARKKSNNILQRIKRNAIMESIAGLVVTVLFCYYIRNHPYFGWMILSLFVIGLMAFIPFIDLIKKIKAVPTQNVVDSIGAYHKILSAYLKKMKIMALVLVPLGFIGGFGSSFMENGGDWEELLDPKRLLLILGLSGLALGGMFWFIFKKQIFHLYQKPLDELKAIHDGLLTQQKIN